MSTSSRRDAQVDPVREALHCLDPRARAVYEAVRAAVTTHGYPPSLREIGAQVGLTSPSSVKHQLDKLERLGLVRRDPRLPRALEVIVPEEPPTSAPEPTGTVPDEPLAGAPSGPDVTDLASHRRAPSEDTALPVLPGVGEGEAVAVPLVGRIAAGSPILAEQEVEDVMALPRRLTGDGELFMLQVHGDSMIDAAICDRDWVVVRAQADAANGEIVAAMVEDVDGASATVKVLSRRDGHQWLLPRNPDYAPIPGDHATIMGKVVTVLRAL
ncbi:MULTISPECIES: transcriptional repressor LexA [unclassified Actinomyces]|uniref:transcriptional repressor LexA n=1 Tax=unclassified Actinomyces TaxID=2609248 RepID=UPI0020175F74|nr:MULTISPECIES: transcriptional repressor LexA [unclassified Actinomyces]MCL3776681.1 transcriptional repressor LexA [Actinomyces sp. AC-20-1]MCL3789800.1 transcriptional repressor LexA [Actinomyces sp. 187325]MCL3792395.1 transcriptional repressor LexA [Actinomyces sp. 186855]MCL3794605.1 transcriptional repressor LexA [Actinomyces sp. 217892]